MSPLAPTNLPTLFAFSRHCQASAFAPARSGCSRHSEHGDWLSAIVQGRIRGVLASLDGEVVGQGSLRLLGTRFPPLSGEVTLSVAPRFRRLGLGRLLSEQVDTFAREAGLRRLTNVLRSDRTLDQAAMSALGFQIQTSFWAPNASGATWCWLVASKRLSAWVRSSEIASSVNRDARQCASVAAGLSTRTTVVRLRAG